MHGALVIDKPQGLTSHDVVAIARRALGETKIGHTGTLDPLATGVLPLAIGRATRLVRFLTASDKDYDATIRFGLETDTYDITGNEVRRTDAEPSRDAVVEALRSLTGEYFQVPPAYSAKKVQGQRAYRLARKADQVSLAPALVHVARADLVEFGGGRARVALTCSAGFYVRSFAQSLGELTGTAACLEVLRRTRSGQFGLDTAARVEELSQQAYVESKLVPLAGLLGHLPALTISDEAREAVSHGRDIPLPSSPPSSPFPVGPSPFVRLLDSGGELVAIATPGQSPASLHPSVVLM